MNETQKHDITTHVGCDVTACKFNTVDRKCCAKSINVENEKANSKGETYCSTFCPRGCC